MGGEGKRVESGSSGSNRCHQDVSMDVRGLDVGTVGLGRWMEEFAMGRDDDGEVVAGRDDGREDRLGVGVGRELRVEEIVDQVLDRDDVPDAI